MPWDEVMHKFKRGMLRSSSGKLVTDRKQAEAIMLSEKRAAEGGISEYQSRKPVMRKGSRGPQKRGSSLL